MLWFLGALLIVFWVIGLAFKVTTGLIHIIAISGIKVALVAGTLHAAARRLRLGRERPARAHRRLSGAALGRYRTGMRLAWHWVIAIALWLIAAALFIEALTSTNSVWLSLPLLLLSGVFTGPALITLLALLGLYDLCIEVNGHRLEFKKPRRAEY